MQTRLAPRATPSCAPAPPAKIAPAFCPAVLFDTSMRPPVILIAVNMKMAPPSIEAVFPFMLTGEVSVNVAPPINTPPPRPAFPWFTLTFTSVAVDWFHIAIAPPSRMAELPSNTIVSNETVVDSCIRTAPPNVAMLWSKVVPCTKIRFDCDCALMAPPPYATPPTNRVASVLTVPVCARNIAPPYRPAELLTNSPLATSIQHESARYTAPPSLAALLATNRAQHCVVR